MKYIYIILIIILYSNTAFSQSLEIAGIVQDSSKNVISGASVTIISGKKTLKGETNVEGRFSFSKVSSYSIGIIVNKSGFFETIRKYSVDEKKEKITLDPIILKSNTLILNEVTINGTPSIIYKNDTVEYRAKDYKVREYANIDELLKKMEGMEVSSSGNLVYQGQQVSKARLNGKDFAGGDVAQAIKNLPADIVEKIQIVDYYDDQADRTGIKTGDAKKLLNITTRPDRSIGNLARFNAAAGDQNRYTGNGIAQHINANRQIGIIGSVNNTLSGIAPNSFSANETIGGEDNGRGYKGSIRTDAIAFNYRDQFGKKAQFNASYTNNSRKSNSMNYTYGTRFGALGDNNFLNETDQYSKTKSHAVNVELEYLISPVDFLRVTSNFNYSDINNNSSVQQLLTGIIHQAQNGRLQNLNKNSTLDGLVFYQHTFKNPKRNFTVQFNAAKLNTDLTNGSDKNIRYYKDDSDAVLKDSLQHYVVEKNNASNVYKAVVTYVEPVNYYSQFEFIGKMDVKKYGNLGTVDSIDNAGTVTRLTNLTNNYDYTYTQGRFALDYWRDNVNYNYTIGVAIIPYSLNQAQGNVDNGLMNRSYVKFAPVFKFQYIWSSTKRLSISYSGDLIEPRYTQLQAFVDKSDPQNIIIGNPNLKAAFNNSITTQFNSYIPQKRVNHSAIIYASIYNNQVVNNVIQVFQPALNNFITETRFLNLGNRYTINGTYGISKQINNSKYNLSSQSSIRYNTSNTMNNNIESANTSWKATQKLSARITFNENIEMNPSVSYDLNSTRFGLNNITTNIRTTSLAIDGRFYFAKTWLLGYSANKNFINGIDYNVSKNPFIINALLEKQFLKRKNLVLNIQVFDILHQNNYINQTVSANSVTYTKTNTQSRYFLIGLRLNLQKWSGTPTQNGIRMQRRGDGSFIY